jgi:hypothetical protein
MFVNCVSPGQVISTMIINTLRPVTRSINPPLLGGFFLPPFFSKGDTETRSVGGRDRHEADTQEIMTSSR